LNCARRIKDIIAVYRDAEDLISIGAYNKGSNTEIDRAIEKIEEINSFLKQGMYEKHDYDRTVEELMNLLD
jgi:flagellum-specific ATP synthase